MMEAEQSPGRTSFFNTGEYNNFMANYRFSLHEVIFELMERRAHQDENFNNIEIHTAEERQALTDILNKAIAVLN